MRMRSTVTGLATTLGLLALSGGAATADMVEPGLGTLKSVGSVDSLQNKSISVRALQFNDISGEVQTFIEEALKAKGYVVRSEGAEYTLSFSTELSGLTDDRAPNTWETATEIGAADEDLDAMPRNQDDDVSVDPVPQVNIPLDSTGEGNGSDYGLSFVLAGSSEVPVWQGAVTATLPAQDPAGVAEAMVPPLVEHMGQAVSDKQVTLK